MKSGDRVILKEFKSNSLVLFTPMMSRVVGVEAMVKSVYEDDGTFSINLDGKNELYWLQSACEPVKNERYFLFAYVSNGNTGNTWLKSENGKVPSHKSLVKTIKEKLSTKNAAVTNIFEFKSEQDYLDFTSNE